MTGLLGTIPDAATETFPKSGADLLITDPAEARVATGDALAEVVGVVPFGLVDVLVASRTSLNFSMNYGKGKTMFCS